MAAGITLDGEIITVAYHSDDGGLGASWSNPYDMDDIIAQSVADEWSPACTKQGDQYYIPYMLHVINADTYFSVIDQQIEVGGMTAVGNSLYIQDAYFRSRGIVSGVQWIRNTNSSTIEQYLYVNSANAEFTNTVCNFRRFWILLATFTDVTFTYCHYTLFYSGTFNRVTIRNSTYGLYPPPGATGTYTNILLLDNTYGFRITNSVDITGLKIVGGSYRYLILTTATPRVLNFTDSEVDLDLPYVIYGAGGGVRNADVNINLISTTNINVEGALGGNIVITDALGNTTYDGEVTADMVLPITYFNHYVYQVLGEVITDTETTYAPFSVVISKNGYMNLEIPNINIVDGVQTYIQGKMVAIPVDPDASGLTNAYETESMRHLFLNEPILKIGDAGGLLPAVTAGSLYAALFTQDPGEAGSIANEATFGGYARVAVPRGPTGWTEFLGKVRNLNQVNFPDCTSGTEIITHYALMKELAGDEMVGRGALKDPAIVIPQYQLQFAPTQMEFNID